MRHFSLFDDMDDGFKKKADDDYDFNRKNMYYTIDAGPDGIGGFLDLITWVRRNEDILRMMPATRSSIPSPQEIEDLTDYLNDLWSDNDNVLRINGEQLSNLRMLSKMFTAIEEEPDQEAFADEYRDLVFDDIQAARESLSGAIPNYSSMESLEDIPTMEKNPEDPTPTTPNATGFLPPATNAGKALAAGNCPKCGSPTTPSVLDPNVLVCSNCGWDGDQLPHLGEQSQEIQNLEQSFNAPSAEHPLGPHTGADEGGQELYTSGRFVNLAKWPSNPVWGVEVNPAAGQRDPMPGDLATIQQKSKAFNRPVPITLVEDMGGAWTFKNGHHPA